MITIQIVNIVFEDLTKAIAKRDLNTILCFDTTGEVAYKEATALKDFIGSDIDEMDTIYTEVLSEIFSQQPQNVAVIGSLIPEAEESTYEDIEPLVLTALNKVANKNFFYVVTNSVNPLTATAIEKWCSANGKIFVFTPDHETSAEAIVEMSAQWNSEQAVIMAHKGKEIGESVYPYNYASAMAGLLAPKPAGSATWFAKSPSGVPLNYYSAEEETALINSKSVNIYKDVLGTGMNIDGRTTAKTFVDITISKFYLRYRLEEAIIRLFATRDKVPFTGAGQALITNAIASVIDQADRMGILVSEETTIDVPNPLDLPENDRANRVWTNIQIVTRLQGSAHAVDIKFVLNV